MSIHNSIGWKKKVFKDLEDDISKLSTIEEKVLKE